MVTNAVNSAIAQLNAGKIEPLKITADTTAAEREIKAFQSHIRALQAEMSTLTLGVGGGSKSTSGVKNMYTAQVSGINRSIEALKREGIVTKEVASAYKNLEATYNSYKASKTGGTSDAMQRDIDATKSAISAQKELIAQYQRVATQWNSAKIASDANSGKTEAERNAAYQRSVDLGNELAAIEERLGVTRDQMTRYTKTSLQQEMQLARQREMATESSMQAVTKLEAYYQKYGAAIQKNAVLQNEYNRLVREGQAGKLDVRSVQQFQNQVRAAGAETETFRQKLQRLFSTRLGTMLSGLAISTGIKMLRDAWQDVQKIDVAMTELKKVTDESDATYARFLDGAGDRAKKYGATIEDVVQATAEFARLGYSLSEATDLGNAAIVLKNVGDGITDISDAAEKLISTLKAFPEFEGNAMNIVDKMNEVGKQYCPAA